MSYKPKDIPDLVKHFEPILLFHPDERFFPIDPKFYLERCALWRNPLSLDKKEEWGEPPPSVFPRRPQLAKGEIAALKNEAIGGKTWIGNVPDLVIPEEKIARSEDHFLQLTGWEPLIIAPNEVTTTSENRHPTLDVNIYESTLQGGLYWYYAEYLDHKQLVSQFANKRLNELDLSKAVIRPLEKIFCAIVKDYFFPEIFLNKITIIFQFFE